MGGEHRYLTLGIVCLRRYGLDADEYRISSADIAIRCVATIDDLIADR